jgi:hypothetical protein
MLIEGKNWLTEEGDGEMEEPFKCLISGQELSQTREALWTQLGRESPLSFAPP